MVTNYVPKDYHVVSATMVINQPKNASEEFVPGEGVCLSTRYGFHAVNCVL